MTITEAATSEELSSYTDERLRDLKRFDESKSGVKGLVDAGVTKIPNIFRHPPGEDCLPTAGFSTTIPIIDLHGFDPTHREKIVEEVRDAWESWGFFQVVNHGIPEKVIEEMKDGVRRFFEQDDEVKRRYYTRDICKKIVYNSNFDLYTASVANWRDTFFCYMAPDPPNPQDLPIACRLLTFIPFFTIKFTLY